MIERVIILENVDPVIFYGLNDSNMQLLRTLFPKLRILARGLVVKAIGDEVEMALFEEKVNELIRYCAEYNLLNESVIIDIVKGNRPPEVKKTTLSYTGSTDGPSSPVRKTSNGWSRLSTRTTSSLPSARLVRARPMWP